MFEQIYGVFPLLIKHGYFEGVWHAVGFLLQYGFFEAWVLQFLPTLSRFSRKHILIWIYIYVSTEEYKHL